MSSSSMHSPQVGYSYSAPKTAPPARSNASAPKFDKTVPKMRSKLSQEVETQDDMYQSEEDMETDEMEITVESRRNTQPPKPTSIESSKRPTTKRSNPVLDDSSYILSNPNSSTPGGSAQCVGETRKKLRHTAATQTPGPASKRPVTTPSLKRYETPTQAGSSSLKLHDTPTQTGVSPSNPAKRKADFEEMDEDGIPSSMRPEKGWVTPQSLLLNKRPRLTAEQKEIIRQAPIVRRLALTPGKTLSWTNALPKRVLTVPIDQRLVDEMTIKRIIEAGREEGVTDTELDRKRLEDVLEGAKKGIAEIDKAKGLSAIDKGKGPEVVVESGEKEKKSVTFAETTVAFSFG
jgi:hypothetical protein